MAWYRSAKNAGLAIGIAAVLAVALTATAWGISAPIHISGTGGQGVNMRTGPGTGYPQVGWIPEGASPDYVCYSWGERINGVPIWFNVNYGGATGFYTSAFDDSSYSSDADLQAKYNIPQCGSPQPQPQPQPSPQPQPQPQPQPSAGLTFSVTNADGGVYYRSSPHWSDTPQTPGVGVYNGDQVQLICAAAGDPVGEYNNTAWSYVSNLTRPQIGNGWVNEHFIADGAPSGGWPAGEPQCDSSTPGLSGAGTPGGAVGPTAPPPAASSSVAVYFSPYGRGDHDLNDSSTRTVHSPGGWQCTDGAAALQSARRVGDSHPISTLAGWSSGRQGVVGYWQKANDDELRSLTYSVLLDPGDAQDFDPCDVALKAGNALAHWLNVNPSARLVVVSGSRTQLDNSKALKEVYFKAVRNAGNAVRARVLVCEYDINHEQAFRGGQWWIQHRIGASVSSCPWLTVPRHWPLPTETAKPVGQGWHP